MTQQLHGEPEAKPQKREKTMRRRNNDRRPDQSDQTRWDSPCPAANSYTNNVNSLNYLKLVLVCVVVNLLIYASQVSCQLPDDIQRELNQNLAEQARLQALRDRHQQQIQARNGQAAAAAPTNSQQASGKPAHDPNNYSYQQVSPPVQYSYYQPYGDLAPKTPQPGAQSAPSQGSQAAASSGQPQQPINIDLNNLNIDIPNLPTPQAQTAGGPQQRAMTPHFTGVGGLPVLQPVAAANQSPDTFAPAGQAPLQPQAQTAGGPQQGPPLTEADFKDITGGENYGAPGGSDFGMAANGQPSGGDDPTGSAEPRASSGNGDSDNAQMREFGMPDEQQQQHQQPRQYAPQQRQDNSMANMMQDLGGFNPMGGGGGGQGARQRQAGGGGFDPFGAAGFGGSGGGGGGFPGLGGDFAGGLPMMGNSPRRQAASRPAPAGDFDFASQPSSQSRGGGGDTAQGVMNGGAPGSLQTLLGNSFPGLGGGNAATMGLDGLARGNNAPESQLAEDNQQQQRGRPRSDDGALDIADLGDRSDGFSGADLGGFEQPGPQNDQDYNYAAAAEQQPQTVPYPDGGPQFLGTLFALGQPQSLTQNRYNALPDKGTYQDYPAYQTGADYGAVAQVVNETPRARRPAPGRYAIPSPSALAPERRMELSAGQVYDYARGPMSSGDGGFSASSLYSTGGDEFYDAGREFTD